MSEYRQARGSVAVRGRSPGVEAAALALSIGRRRAGEFPGEYMWSTADAVVVSQVESEGKRT